MSKACSREIVRNSLASDGQLAWIPLILACYESEAGKLGRFLLFDPQDCDRPLDDLSLLFEELLQTRIPPLYYPPDPISTASYFWYGLASQSHTLGLADDLADFKASFAEVPELIHTSSQHNPRTPLFQYLTDCELCLNDGRYQDAGSSYQAAAEEFLRVLCEPASRGLDRMALTTLVDQQLFADKIPAQQQEFVLQLLVDLAERRSEMEYVSLAHSRLCDMAKQSGFDMSMGDIAKGVEEEPSPGPRLSPEDAKYIREIEARIRCAPVIHHLRTPDHAEWLRKALTKATQIIVIVSPWIKKRVLKPLLPSIASAIGRGCRIWIGHGMPPNAFHKDGSDPEALELLDSFGEGLTRIDNLGTHEKILICDDEFCVVTSYNWLSFDGTDRRERGIVQFGSGVSALRDEYVTVMERRARRAAPLVL